MSLSFKTVSRSTILLLVVIIVVAATFTFILEEGGELNSTKDAASSSTSKNETAKAPSLVSSVRKIELRPHSNQEVVNRKRLAASITNPEAIINNNSAPISNGGENSTLQRLSTSPSTPEMPRSSDTSESSLGTPKPPDIPDPSIQTNDVLSESTLLYRGPLCPAMIKIMGFLINNLNSSELTPTTITMMQLQGTWTHPDEVDTYQRVYQHNKRIADHHGYKSVSITNTSKWTPFHPPYAKAVAIRDYCWSIANNKTTSSSVGQSSDIVWGA